MTTRVPAKDLRQGDLIGTHDQSLVEVAGPPEPFDSTRVRVPLRRPGGTQVVYMNYRRDQHRLVRNRGE